MLTVFVVQTSSEGCRGKWIVLDTSVAASLHKAPPSHPAAAAAAAAARKPTANLLSLFVLPRCVKEGPGPPANESSARTQLSS